MRQSTPMRPTDRPLVNDQKMTDSNEGNVLVVHTTTITVREGGREGGRERTLVENPSPVRGIFSRYPEVPGDGF